MTWGNRTTGRSREFFVFDATLFGLILVELGLGDLRAPVDREDLASYKRCSVGRPKS